MVESDNKIQSKIIIILGQTSTGKSDFAVEVSRRIGGEVISADSRQVYKGMNLGTGKITKKEMKSVPHHLLDVISPKKIYTVSEYKKQADRKIKEIIRRGKTPIIVGGTGFYIDAVVDGIVLPEVAPNTTLRAHLAKKTTPQLYTMLHKLDSRRAETIDANNPVRLIRAIEIAKSEGLVPALSHSSPYRVFKIGLTLPDEVLKEKIKVRLISRIKKRMLREIKDLHTQGISWKRMEILGLEYRYGALYLQKKITKDEMIKKICTETWHYAKRQKTWFKKDTSIIWIDPREIHEQVKALKAIKDFLT